MIEYLPPTASGPCRRCRAGFSMLELQVAFVLFAMALAGLCPLVVLQSKHLKVIEARLNHQTTYYLTPSSNAWARKLGVAASIQTTDPGPPAPPPVLIIDNGDPGYVETGTGWRGRHQTKALNGNLRWHPAGTGADTASWTFLGLIPGWYQVQVTWLPGGNRATNAPYTVYDGLTSQGTVLVDQTSAPSGPVFQGIPWQILGTFSLGTGPLQVQLTDQANGRVIADGVRVVPVQNLVQILSLDRSLTSEQVTAHVSLTVQVP